MVPWAGCGVQALCFSLADIDVSKRKKMFELQPNVFRNLKGLPTLIYTLTRLIYSREIFEMFKTFLVFFFHETGRAHVSQRVQQVGSCDVPMEFLSRDDKWWMSEASHN